MSSGRASRLLVSLNSVLIASLIGIGWLIAYNSSGPVQETYGTVVSSRYAEGLTITTHVQIGEGIHVPVTTKYPGNWIVEVDSPVLGRRKVSWSKSLPAGREVYLEYVIGRLSHEPELAELRLERRPIKAPE